MNRLTSADITYLQDSLEDRIIDPASLSPRRQRRLDKLLPTLRLEDSRLLTKAGDKLVVAQKDKDALITKPT